MREATSPSASKSKAPRKASPPRRADDTSQPERLQKVLAAAGLGSRRDCETLIEEGRVTVDRQIVTILGTRVDVEKQEIRVDGELLPRPKRHYFAVNKPTNVVSTNADPDGRMRVIDLVGTQHRLFTVGRLDKSSEGLILVTNDGELANQLTHPRYGVEKTYRVIVAGAPSPAELRQLTEGVHLADGLAKAKRVKFKKKHHGTSELEMVLDEGRNREIRRLLARIGHKVLRLRRIAIGPLLLEDLPTGGVRRLHTEEVEALYAAVGRRP